MNAILEMFRQVNWLDTYNVTSSPVSADGPMLCASPDGRTIAPYGRAHVRANLSARQAADAGLLTSGIYGRLGSISSQSADLSFCLVSKFQALTACSGSILYKATWRVRRTASAAPIYALRASARPTYDSEYSSSRTFAGWA